MPPHPEPARRFVVRLAATLALSASGFLGPVPTSAQNGSNGPLTYEEGSPLQRISYTAMMETAATTPAKGWTVDVALGVSNIFEQDSSATHVLFLDLERVVSTVAARWGATDRLEVGARLTLETTGGGVLDGVILSWHERLGLGQANRDRFPEGAYSQRLTDGNGTTFLDVPSRKLGFEDARLFAKWLAASSDDGRSLLSFRVETRLPGGSNRISSERVDWAAMTLGRVAMGSWYAHGMLGASTIRAPEELESILRSSSTFLAIGLERSFGPVSAVAQYHAQSPTLRSFEHRELDRSPTNFLLGLSGRLGDHWRWDASFQEDLPADTPAIDFTIGLRVSRIW